MKMWRLINIKLRKIQDYKNWKRKYKLNCDWEKLSDAVTKWISKNNIST